MRQSTSRLFFRPLTLSVAAACGALLAAGCTSPAPAPTVTQLLASAAAGLRSGQPCTIHGDVVIGPTDGIYDIVSSVSASDHFSALITQHLPGAEPLVVPTHLIDTGSALYYQSAVGLRLAYNGGPVPASLTGLWVRFPSWPGLSPKAFDAEQSAMSQYSGPGGDALGQLAIDSVTVIYQGGSCGLLLAKMRSLADLGSTVVSGEVNGRPVFTFTVAGLFESLAGVQYRITMSQGTPVRLLRVTGDGDVLSLSYPARIAPISAPPAAQVIPATQIPGLPGGQ